MVQEESQLERRKVPKKVGRITESNRININRKELYNRMKRESIGKIIIVQIKSRLENGRMM